MSTPFLKSLKTALDKKEFTNLYVYEILIEDYLKRVEPYRGLLSTEVAKLVREGQSKGRYVKDFHESYLNRKVRPRKLGLSPEGRYHILKDDQDPDRLAELLKKITQRIDEPDPIHERIGYISSEVDIERLIGNLAEWIRSGTANDFEVASYCVLSMHFGQFGFKLHRFSSTNANDGGADFIGGDAVYCVTTQLNVIKLESDMFKTHANKIIIHRNNLDRRTKEMLETFMNAGTENGRVLKVLNADDIINVFLSNLSSDLKRNERSFIELKGTLVSEYKKELL
jgi:hypothetical protein